MNRRLTGAVIGLVLLLFAAPALAQLPGATPGPHEIDAAGIQFLTSDRYDSLRLKPYDDPVHCTIGYGYKISDLPCEDPRIRKKVQDIARGFTKEKAVELLRQQVAAKSGCVNRDVTVPINQDQFDVLVDFAYNAGCGALARVAKYVNEGNLPGAAAKLKEYNKGEVPVGKGKHRHKVLKVLGGLVTRRGQEAQVLDGGTTLGKLLAGKPKPKPKPKPKKGPCYRGNTGGGIDVLLQGEFFGQTWASGTVTATGAGIQTESASVGYDYVSAGHFGPWLCGSTVTLTATPARGNHFDHWQSSDGSCTGTAPTCTLHITTKAMSATALFAPTTHQLTVINGEPDGVVSSGDASGGYVNPSIQCGSPSPNGPGTPVYTACSSPALAQRSDDDLTELYVSADRPGPGGDDYGIASIDGCDSSAAVTAPLSEGGTFVPSLQCFIDLNSDRTITVHYKDVGAN